MAAPMEICETTVRKTKDESQFYVPKRLIFMLLAFCVVSCLCAFRSSFSVAVVAMVNQSRTDTESYNLSSEERFEQTHAEDDQLMMSSEDSKDEEQFKGEQYDWDETTQGIILGAFFYGYVSTQILGGYFSKIYRAKWIFCGGMLASAISYLLIPLVVSWGASAVICIRVLQGIGEGIVFPSLTTLLSRWSPKAERSRISAFIWTGIQFGNCSGMIIAGYLCSAGVLGGWPLVFYVFGTFGGLCFVACCCFMYESPMKHPTISKEELLHFESNEILHKQLRPPWKDIFSSLPFWAYAVAFLGTYFGQTILLTELPSYLYRILHFDIKSSGYFSALPYLFQGASCLLTSVVADKLRKSEKLSITTIRKIFNSIGEYGPSICLLGITISGCNRIVIITLFSIALALNGCTLSGFGVNNIDMSPDFAGTIFSIVNTLTYICGSTAPSIVAAILSSGVTAANWNYVFYLTAAVFAGAATFYVIFASAELQPWGATNDEQEKSTQKEANGQVKYEKTDENGGGGKHKHLDI